jgi:hypothetical protein
MGYEFLFPHIYNFTRIQILDKSNLLLCMFFGFCTCELEYCRILARLDEIVGF